MVGSHCGQNFDCLHHAYQAIMDSMERKFNLPGAIFAGEELAEIARKYKVPEVEAQARLNICRYQDAMGNARQAAINIEYALQIFKQVGDPRKITLAKYWKLRIGARFLDAGKGLPEMEALLEEAKLLKDTGLLARLYQFLSGKYCISARYNESAKHLDSLEVILKSNPSLENAPKYQMYLFKSRGDIAWATGHPEEARESYQHALHFSQTIPDRWIEVKCLLVLADLNWELKNRPAAKSYLEQAHTLAKERKLDELLISSFRLKTGFAEGEGRYAEALESLKEMHKYEVRWENRASGSIVQNYFLEAENQNRKLELSLKNTQLRYSLLVIFLILLLSGGVFVAYYKQRQGKRKLSEQNARIQQQSEQLKSLDAAKSRFFTNVSHELRTPLTLLLGPVRSLLKENHLTEKQAYLLQMADRSGKQLEQLVNEILDLRKLEMGKMGVEEKPTGLRTYFLTYFAQFESLAERKQVDYSMTISIDDETVANIDQEKCRQILFNLLSNAFKFTPAGGQIVVKVSVENGRLQLTVADTGPGIHPDDQPYLFDRFFQTTRPDKPAEGGTGIGLNLCQEYARLFGGSIEVESTLGQGSVFRVEFPVTLAKTNAPITIEPLAAQRGAPAHDEVSISPLTGASETPRSTRPTILVVEDNHDLQDYIRSILSEKYHVVTAENGKAALDCLLSAAPAQCQLILSDLMMPVMDGYQLLEQLKSNDATRHIPAIMLTARAEANDRLKALRIGVDDYLTKPFDEEELLARIENLLKNQAARLEEISPEAGPEGAIPVMSQPDREWLEKFEAYVQQHFASDILTVASLASEFAMSKSTLLRQLRRLTGLSPVQYLQEVRLEEARRLLENRSCDSVAQVAIKVGYDDARSFTRSFRQRYGKLPSQLLGA